MKKVHVITIYLMVLILLSGPSIVPAGAQTDRINSIIELSQEHINAVNRRRRVVLQYDAWRWDLGVIGTDFENYMKGTFESVDQPGSQPLLVEY